MRSGEGKGYSGWKADLRGVFYKTMSAPQFQVTELAGGVGPEFQNLSIHVMPSLLLLPELPQDLCSVSDVGENVEPVAPIA